MTEIKEKFSKALTHIVEIEKINQVDLASRCGVSPQSINDYKSGRREGRENTRKAIAEGIGWKYEDMLSLGQWIIDGKNPKDWAPSSRNAEPSNVSPGPSLDHAHKIPIISWVQAGDWKDVFDPYHPGDADDWIKTTETNNPNAFALIVRGDSMEPEFADGDIITVDPGRDAEEQ